MGTEVYTETRIETDLPHVTWQGGLPAPNETRVVPILDPWPIDQPIVMGHYVQLRYRVERPKIYAERTWRTWRQTVEPGGNVTSYGFYEVTLWWVWAAEDTKPLPSEGKVNASGNGVPSL